MRKKYISRRIIIYEAAGFAVVLAVVWLDEILDLPYLFMGQPATPINYVESLFESVLIMLSAGLVIFVTGRLLARIKYLEGFLPVCAFCKRIRIDKEWIPIEEYITKHSEAQFSHGFCPDCGRKHYGDYLDK